MGRGLGRQQCLTENSGAFLATDYASSATAPWQYADPKTPSRALERAFGKLLRNGRVGGGELSAKTVGHVHRCLRRAFGHAAQWGLITQNPATLVHPPRVQQAEMEILRENEVEAMFANLRDRNALLHTIAIVA